jgi:hypothetical protein
MQYVLGPYVDKIGYLPLFTMTAVLHPIAAIVAIVGLGNRKPVIASNPEA